MLPYRDINPTRRTPWLTWALLLVNVLVHLFQASLPPAAQARFLTQPMTGLLNGFGIMAALVGRFAAAAREKSLADNQ